MRVSGKFFDPKLASRATAKSLRQLLGDIARESCFAVRRVIPRNFRLRRDWIVRGIRYEAPRGEELRARVLTLDTLLEKHEEGASFHDKAMVQARFLYEKGRTRTERPKILLGRKSFFALERGIFERVGRAHLRTWYVRTGHRDYHERLHMLETVNRIAGQMGRSWRVSSSLVGPPGP